MDGRKLHHFVCFAVTMGLVACASGISTLTSAATSTVTIPLNESTTEPQVSSTTTELDPTSSFTSSRPAPSSAVTPSVRAMVTSESKSCPTEPDAGKCQTALCQIMSRALLFTCIVLLITVTALACKVNHLKGRLINGAGRWGVGETSVMLEEVIPVQNEEETAAWSVARVQYGH